MGQAKSQLPVAEVGVYLLTENRLLRELLTRLLLKKAGISVAGVSGSPGTAVKEFPVSGCEILLTDCFDSADNPNLISEIAETAPQLKAVLFGMDEDPQRFLKAVASGVYGYVLKDGSDADIVAAIRTVAAGGAICPPTLCLHLIQSFAKERARALSIEAENSCCKPPLTHRQLELVNLVAKGLTNKEIAASLNLSEFTVKNHMRRILKLVDAQDRYEAVSAIRESGGLSAG